MILYYVYRRLAGDELSIHLCGEGSLSTACLNVNGSEYEEARYLPGITVKNMVKYLAMIGFRDKHDYRNHFKDLQKFFIDSGLCVDEVVVDGEGCFVVGLILQGDRRMPCPVVRGFVRFSADLRGCKVVRILDHNIEKMLKHICK